MILHTDAIIRYIVGKRGIILQILAAPVADQLFYLMSRGYTKSNALSMIVEGFIEPFIKELPLEFSVELPRLLNLKMEHPAFNYP